jgi:hypothetical protein
MAFVLVARLVLTVGGTILQDPNPPRHKLLEYPPAVDNLPPGSKIANGIDRPWSYALLGRSFPNRVIDTFEAMRLFQTASGRWSFTEDSVRASGITHFFVKQSESIETGPCVVLTEIARLAENPFNGVAYDSPRVLYAVSLCRGPRPPS